MNRVGVEPKVLAETDVGKAFAVRKATRPCVLVDPALAHLEQRRDIADGQEFVKRWFR